VPLFGLHPVEMGMAGQPAAIPQRLGRDDCYRRMFAAAFPESGGAIDLANTSRALAAFQRTLLSFDTPYDRFLRGMLDAIPPQAKRGAAAFAAACAGCHSGADFTDRGFHALVADSQDRGLGEATGRVADDRRFRTPGLRNVALTAPYLHDGSAATLAQAIRRHAPASDAELPDLLAFMDTLTDRTFVTDPRFSLPKTHCGKKP